MSVSGSGRRVAIVTGGTYGIGRAITLALAREGCAVVAFGIDRRQADGTRAALDELGLTGETLEGDVSVGADVQRAVEFTIGKYGQIDALCNNAGIRPLGTILETDEETWDRAFAVNIKGMYLFTRAVLPHMIARGGGVIINTASTAGYGKDGRIAYCSSKGAIFPFTRSLAIDHLKDRIRVNAIVPGPTLTGMTENSPPERLRAMGAHSVAGRMNTPEEIAHAVAFLVSDKARTITGAIWEVGTSQGGTFMGIW